MSDPKIRIRASDDTGPAFRSANNNLRELQESAATIGASLGGALGAAGIAALVTGAIDAADELAKLSQRAGVTVDVMGGLAFNADLAGDEVDRRRRPPVAVAEEVARPRQPGGEVLQAVRVLAVRLRAHVSDPEPPHGVPEPVVPLAPALGVVPQPVAVPAGVPRFGDQFARRNYGVRQHRLQQGVCGVEFVVGIAAQGGH